MAVGDTCNSRRPDRRRAAGLCVACSALGFALGLLGAAPAGAGDFYVSGGLSIDWGVVDTTGDNFIGTPPPISTNTGSDSDSSPVVTGAFGFEVPFHQLLPRRMPRWMPDVDLEDWAIRTEIEVAGARQYDLVAGPGAQTHRISFSHLTLMFNGYLDLPLGHAWEALFGRARTLEPLVFSPNFGVGYGRSDFKSDNNFATSNETYNDFAWQAGAEFGYPLGDSVVLSAGYRYVSVGTFDNDVSALQPAGNLALDIGAHEIHTAIRVRFFSVRFPRGLFESKRSRYEP